MMAKQYIYQYRRDNSRSSGFWSTSGGSAFYILSHASCHQFKSSAALNYVRGLQVSFTPPLFRREWRFIAGDKLVF